MLQPLFLPSFYQQREGKKLQSAHWTKEKSSFLNSTFFIIIFLVFVIPSEPCSRFSYFLIIFLLLAPWNLGSYHFSKTLLENLRVTFYPKLLNMLLWQPFFQSLVPLGNLEKISFCVNFCYFVNAGSCFLAGTFSG